MGGQSSWDPAGDQTSTSTSTVKLFGSLFGISLTAQICVASLFDVSLTTQIHVAKQTRNSIRLGQKSKKHVQSTQEMYACAKIIQNVGNHAKSANDSAC